MTVKLVIDTDPGIDDAMALVFAGLHPEIEILGLTSVFGNVYVETATRNALYLAELLGLEIPVSEGASHPQDMARNPISDYVHGREGFGDLPAQIPSRTKDPRPAHLFISEMVRAHKGEITLCPLGPLTNIARALEFDPEIASLVKELVIMGGGLYRKGNVTPHAEANIWNDPHAADCVFSADWPIRMIGLDVTAEITCTQKEFDALAEANPKHGKFLSEMTPFYMAFYEKAVGLQGCMMHDPAAVIATINPALFTYEDVPLTVTTKGQEIGATIPTKGRKPIQVATQVKPDKVKEVFFRTIAEEG